MAAQQRVVRQGEKDAPQSSGGGAGRGGGDGDGCEGGGGDIQPLGHSQSAVEEQERWSCLRQRANSLPRRCMQLKLRDLQQLVAQHLPQGGDMEEYRVGGF